ncbi:MAG: protein transcription factor [Nitrospirae bacterium]|nr:MAG: protein transcription factor [Nitrospirota bacterium]
MALNIKNPQVERLAAEVAAMAGESKTEAVRRALEERRARLQLAVATGSRASRLSAWLEEEVWPLLPPEERGRRLGREEEEAILGLGPEGV